jgi:hypothetical protein
MAVKAVAEGVAEVLVPKTHLRQEKVPRTAVAAKKAVYIESMEAASVTQTCAGAVSNDRPYRGPNPA